MRLLCMLSVASLLACNAPDFTAAKTAFGECTKTAECRRNGTVCAEGVCVEPGLDWDGGVPVDVGSALDASPPQDAQTFNDIGLLDSGAIGDVEVVSDTGAHSDAGVVTDAGVAGTEVFAVYSAVLASSSQQACRNKGGSLAWVSSEAENLQLLAACDQASTGGVCRIGMDEPFIGWLNDTPITFRGFATEDTGFPGTNAYLFIRSNSAGPNNIRVAGEWGDGADSSVNFVCRQSESSSIAGALAVVPTTTPRPNGSTENNAAQTCSTLHDDYPNLENGIYWIDPDGDVGNQAYRARCDMDTLGGGWTIVKRWGSGDNYSNRLFMDRSNSMGRSASAQGSVQDSTYAVPYEGALDEANEVLLGWEFTQQNEVDYPTGYVYWDANLNDFNPGADTMDACSGEGFWTRLQGGCEYSNGDASVLGQSHIFIMSSWLIGDLEGEADDRCSSRAWDNEAGLSIPNPGGEPSGNQRCRFYDDGHIWIAVRRSVGPDGSTVEAAAPSCKAIKDDHPTARSAAYWLDPDAEGEAPAYQVWCDMMYNGGGWQLVTIVSNADNVIVDDDSYYAFQADLHVAVDPVNSVARGSLPLAQPFTEVMVQLSELPGWHLRYVASGNDQWAEWYRNHLAGFAPASSWGSGGKHMADRDIITAHIKTPGSPEVDAGLIPDIPYCYSQSNTNNQHSTAHRMAMYCTAPGGNLTSFYMFADKPYHELNDIPAGTSHDLGGKILFWVR